ncbi:MAG: hypothetical protein AAFU79_24320 [Myxococcota bacterium]
MVPPSLLVALALAAPHPSVLIVKAPALEGGSEIRVDAAGFLDVRDPYGERRWSVGLGGPARQVVADDQAVYAATRRELRAFAGGVARWALDLGSPSDGLRVLPSGALAVRLPAGTVFVDPRDGRFCTPRDPCSGLPAYRMGPIGVPYLDLVGLGVPGLGLILNPALLGAGDVLSGLVSPGVAPGVLPAPLPVATPKARSLEIGTVELEEGATGKVRGFRIGGPQSPPVTQTEIDIRP